MLNCGTIFEGMYRDSSIGFEVQFKRTVLIFQNLISYFAILTADTSE